MTETTTTDELTDSGGVPPLRTVLAAVLLLTTIALLTLGILLWSDRSSTEVTDKARAAVLAVARSQTVALTDVNVANVDARIKEIGSHATGDFQRQFTNTASTFKSVVVDSKIESKSSVAEAGVVSIGKTRAVVLVALASSVHNPTTGKDEPRPYRIKIHLQLVHGRWLVSKMEFVA